MKKKSFCTIVFACCILFITPKASAQKNLGIFDGQSDVGNVIHKGNCNYTAQTQEYTMEGAGNNIWFNHDGFHYVWKKMKGDFILRANAGFIGKGAEDHRKIGWMVRASLDSTAAHVTAVVHGDGLTSLQYRKHNNDTMGEIKSSLTGADVIQLERRGTTYIMSVARNGELFVTSQLSDANLDDEVYVGLFICSHNANIVEKAVFKNVRIIVPAKTGFVPYKDYIGSDIEILDIANANSNIIYQSPKSLQAPNWMHDGKSLLYNSEGLLYTFDLASHTPALLNTGSVKNNNNDHVISFDGQMLGISSSGPNDNVSIVYTLPISGGEPKRITRTGPSYLHGWSPDGKDLVFVGERNNEYDIYKISADGGDETNLTNTKGLDDGCEYSPDGKYIYFNSVRSGRMQIWRMKPDGSEQQQLTSDTLNNWFPHISPDGKWIVYISFGNDVAPDDHPFYKHVYLRLMPVEGGASKVIAYVYGGQGTINTPSWSPDSKKIAFVSNTSLLFDAFPSGK